MFEVGEKVACILDDWGEPPATCIPFPLKRNQIVTVMESIPAGHWLGYACKARLDIIGIGVENTDLRVWCGIVGMNLPSYDLWPADWFRRLQRLDTSESMKMLVGLFNKQSTPEVISA